MNHKVTIIGSAPGQAAAPAPHDAPVGEGYQPTRIPSSPVPAPPAPAESAAASPAPTRATAFVPTSIPAKVVVPAAPAQRIEPTSLPGVRRRPTEVSMQDLDRRFPAREPELLERTRALVMGLHVPSMTASTWLAFGRQEQETLADLVRDRLKQNQDPRTRAIAQHLHRLNELLSLVLEAFDGGFLRKSPIRVWTEHEGEVQQLEQLLRTSDDVLSAQLSALESLKSPAADCGQRLDALALAAEYLADHAGQDATGLVTGRLASLTSSQATQMEHVVHLEQDINSARELIALVQDGVLVKLPGVYTQLATVAAKPTDTQRFLAVEAITDIIQTLNRKNP